MFLNPEEILKKLNLQQNLKVADFGSGSGGFTIPLAEYLEDGYVYALDIQEEPLNVLKERSKHLANLEVKKCDLEVSGSSGLEDNSLDVVFLINVLTQVEDLEKVIQEVQRVLKPEGKLLIIDWLENVSMGPEEKRVALVEVQKIAESQGLEKQEDFSAGPYHYGLLMKKA